MKKRLLAWLLTLVMLLALLPGVALAADNWDDWTKFDGTILSLSGGNYYLNTNVTADSTIYIDGTVTLDLNGHTLTCSATSEDIFCVRVNATLTVQDSGIGGTVDGQNTNCGFNVKGGTLILESGTIKNCYTNGDGSAVDVAISSIESGSIGGKFIMNGGTIQDCTANDDGGAVDIGSECKFTMNGGTISNCKAGHEGGGVYVKENGAKFSMHGSAKIENCQAVRGGGVYVEKGGIVNAERDMIVGCTAKDGDGALYVKSSGTTSGVHTVTFDSNGGSAVPQQMCVNAPAAKPADPVRYGYTFAGWYKDGAEYDFSQVVSTDLTLTAQWTTPVVPVTPVTAVEEPTTPWWNILPALDQTADFPFCDVDSNDWFYEAVKSVWEQELIDGVTARYFKPDSTLTVAQAIKLAAALHQKQSVGFVTLQNGGTHWYDNYVNYAVANGLIEAAYQNKSAETMNAAVSRAEFVHILSKLLNAGTINTVNTIPDVKSGDAYADEIFAFYRAGILTGSDRLGTFHPESSLKRSEAAAILVRLYDTAQRQYITLR